MSEVFKICCSIRQRKSPKRVAQVCAQTFRNSLALRHDSFAERTFEQKYACAMLFHLYLEFRSVFMQSEMRNITAPGQTQVKGDEEMEIVNNVSSGRCLVN